MFDNCPITKRSFLIDSFPKKCNSCSKIYKSRSQYLKETNNLKNGIFGSSRGDFFYEYRNCICGSTLVIKFKNERDFSRAGDLKRKFVRSKIIQYQSLGNNYQNAKKKALEDFEKFEQDIK